MPQNFAAAQEEKQSAKEKRLPRTNKIRLIFNFQLSSEYFTEFYSLYPLIFLMLLKTE